MNAIAIFTPTIVHELGFSAASSQLLSAPPFACGSILAISVGMFSDRMNLRGPFLVAGATFSMIGYIIAYTTSTPGPGYAGAVMAACGAIPLIPLALIWSGMNSGGIVKRGAVLAIVTGISNLGRYAFLHFCRDEGVYITLKCLCFVCLLSAATFSHGPRCCDRLPGYDVCASLSSQVRTTNLFCVW